ncbi:MAG TPA: replicative DNA helicase [Acidobacteriaceae bacterium]|jgi:replicative DNA helicase
MTAKAAPDLRFERGLPASLDAERTILGAVLLDNAAYAEASAKLAPEDFALTAHQRVFRRMGDIITRRQQCDIVTLSETLGKHKEIESVGGVAWLASLTEGLPRRLSIIDYVAIVLDKAMLRQLIGIHSDAITRAADQSEEAESILSSARSAIEALSSQRVETGLQLAAEYLASESLTAAAMMDRTAKDRGIQSGITDLDTMTCGLQRGELVIVAARPSMGKAQPVTAKVLTPRGFVPMGCVEPGFEIVGRDGRPYHVTAVFPQGDQAVFEVLFSDGTKTRCTEDHLWWTQTRNERRRGMGGSVKTLRDIRRTLVRPDSATSPNHAVPLPAPIEFIPHVQRLLLDPYVMGVLLGDGSFSMGQGARFSKPDVSVHDLVRSRLHPDDELSVCSDGETCIISSRKKGQRRSVAFRALAEYDLLGHKSTGKFIPLDYLRASVSERFALLRGLIDTDGHVNGCGNTIELSSSSRVLATDILNLARSLGLRVSEADRIPTYSAPDGKKCGARNYRLRIWADDLELLVSSEKHLQRVRRKTKVRRTHKAVVAISHVGREVCQCIKVDAPGGLYITDDFIVTHNSDFADNLAGNVALNYGKTVALFSPEMDKYSVLARIVCARGRVDRGHWKSGKLTSEDRRYFADALEELKTAPLYINDCSSPTVSRIRSESMHLKARAGLDLLIVDYLQLMSAADFGKVFNREQEVAKMSGGMKRLAKDLGVPVVLLAQISRENTKRTDKRPVLSDLRESGAIEQDADVVAFLHREEYYERENKDHKGKGEIIIAKQRNGAVGTVHAAYNAVIGRWSDTQPDEATEFQMGFNKW